MRLVNSDSTTYTLHHTPSTLHRTPYIKMEMIEAHNAASDRLFRLHSTRDMNETRELWLQTLKPTPYTLNKEGDDRGRQPTD